MLPSRYAAGFSWVEVIVLVSLIGILFALAFPMVGSRGCGGGQMQTLSNMRQLHLATQTMALDSTTTGDTNIGWPGDLDGTFTTWSRQLVPSYLGTNDFCKLLSAPGVMVPRESLPASMDETAVRVYAVSSNSPSETVFLTSANFTNTPSGGAPLLKSAKPYGDKGFIVFRQGGDGAILLPKQVGNTNLIGGYAPLLR